MAETKPVQSLLRGLDLLQILAQTDSGMRLQDLAERVQLKVPTTHNLLRTLALRGFVEKFDGCMYVLGSAMRQIAGVQNLSRLMLAAEESALVLGGKPYRPFINVCRVSSARIEVRLRISPDAPSVVQRPAGRNNELYSTAAGLAVLAFAPEDLALSLKEQYPFEEYGLPFWKTRDALAECVELARREGVAVFPWQKSELYKIATIIQGEGNTTILGVAIPMTRAADEKVRERAVKDLLTEAHQLSIRLTQANAE